MCKLFRVFISICRFSLRDYVHDIMRLLTLQVPLVDVSQSFSTPDRSTARRLDYTKQFGNDGTTHAQFSDRPVTYQAPCSHSILLLTRIQNLLRSHFKKLRHTFDHFAKIIAFGLKPITPFKLLILYYHERYFCAQFLSI